MASKQYPSVQELLAIWSSNIPLSDCYDVYISSSNLLQSKQHRYLREWKTVVISKDVIAKIISIVCCPEATESNNVLIKDLRRHAIVIFSSIMKNCLDNTQSYTNIKHTILSRKVLLIETLFIFALQDQKCYSSVYDIFLTIIPMLDSFDELLRIGTEIVTISDIVVKKVNYHNCIEFLLSQLYQDLSYSIPCLSLIIEISNSVEIDSFRSFPIERHGHLLQKLLTMHRDMEALDHHLQVLVKFLRIILSQEASPELKAIWYDIVPSMIAEIIHDKDIMISPVTRRDMYLFVILSSSNIILRPNIQALFPRHEFIMTCNDNSTMSQAAASSYSDHSSSNSNSKLGSIVSCIMRIEYELELYCMLYLSNQAFPVYTNTNNDHRSASHTNLPPHDNYILSIITFIKSSLQQDEDESVTMCAELDRCCDVWMRLNNIFSYLSKYIVINTVGVMEEHVIAIADNIVSRIIRIFESTSKHDDDPITSNQVDQHDDGILLSSTYYMLATLNLLCGLQPSCWQVEQYFIPADLLADADLIESKATSLLLQDVDDQPTSPHRRSYSLSDDATIINNCSNKAPQRGSMDMMSPLQQRIHDRFLEYDLMLISTSSASWFMDDIGFLSSPPPSPSSPSPSSKSTAATMKSITESKRQAWKLLYILICVRYIGLWRLIISGDSASSSAHGLDVTAVIESIIALLTQSYPAGYSPSCMDTSCVDAYRQSQYMDTVMMICMHILSLLLHHHHPAQSCHRDSHHTRSSSSPSSSMDHSSYDLPITMISPASSTALYEFCLNSISLIFNKQHRSSLSSYRSSSTIGQQSVSIIYECMSTMTSLAIIPSQTITRREIMRNFAISALVIMYMDPFSSCIPLLVLLHVCHDRISKLPEQCEEKMLRLMLVGFRGDDKHVKMLICDLIANIGEVHPGLIYRVIGRPEVEDQLLYLLQGHQLSSYGSSTSCRLYHAQLYTIMRACAACVRDINPKPAWIRLSGSCFYSWRVYCKGLRCRHLLHESTITLAITRALSSASLDASSSIEPILIIVFAELLAFVTALMYNCADGVLASVATRFQDESISVSPSTATHNNNHHIGMPIDDDMTVTISIPAHEGCNPNILKDELIMHVIPVLPRALDLITLRETLYHSSPKPAQSPSRISISHSDNSTSNRNSISHDIHIIPSVNATKQSVSVDNIPSPMRASITGSTSSASLSSASSKNKGKMSRSKSNGNLMNVKNLHFNLFHRQSTTSNPDHHHKSDHKHHHDYHHQPDASDRLSYPDLDYDNSSTGGATVISLASTLETSASYAIPANKALLLLSAKTLDAVFAFLCLDEMFPMSTYLRNISIFHNVPLVTCVCYTMIRYHADDFIQKRGIGILKAFAFNQIEISSLSINAPLAIYAAFKSLSQDSEIQINCSKIILVIASYDDSCRENILRYNIYSEVLSVILQVSENIDALGACCSALTALCQTKRNVYMLTMGGKCLVHESLLSLLKRFPTEKRIQVESLRALIALTDNSEQVAYMIAAPNEEGRIKDSAYLSTLRRTSRYLHELIRTDELQPEYSREEVQRLLSSDVINIQTDNCSIS